MVRGRLLALTVLLTVGAGAGSASAATITLNTFFDDQQAGDGQCSLRKAVQDVDSPGSSQTDCAPAAFGANTIVMPAGRYQLGGTFPPPGQLTIAPIVKNLTIAGANQSNTTVDAGALNDRVFQISGGANVTLTNLTIVNGNAQAGAAGSPGGAGLAGASGGAILNQGALTLTNATISNSHAGNGGSGGAGSTAGGGDGGAGGSGGAIYNTGTLSLSGDTISSDTGGNGGTGGAGAQGDSGATGGNGGLAGVGGGIENTGGTLNVTGSTIRGNTAGNGGVGGNGGTGAKTTGGNGGNGAAGANGGGIWSDGGALAISNSTFASNTAGAGGTGGTGGPGTTANGGNGGSGGPGGSGGGFGEAGSSNSTLLQVTAAGNNAGAGGTGGGGGSPGGTTGSTGPGGTAGGVLAVGTPITLRNSLLAVSGGGNCSASVLDGGFNLSFGDASCPASFGSGDPNLGPLQNNGGPAPTISLQSGSAAINAIPSTGANCPASDERGAPRPSGSSASKCDIGAYEVVGPVAITGSATSVTLNGATLIASATPYAGSAAIVFQYGTTTKYGKATSVQKLGGVVATPVTAKLTGLRPNTTYHYRVVVVAMDGSATGADRTVTTSVTPAITGLSVSPKSFKASVGTTVGYSESKAARTTLTALRCTKTVRGRCTRYSKLGSFTRNDRAGRNTVKIKGRFGGKKLLTGRYKLELTPRAAGKAGKTVSALFQVI
jgi:hypothetical protein